MSSYQSVTLMTEMKKMITADIHEVTRLWYETSIIAHDFIPESYWNKNRELMKTIHLPASETVIVRDKTNILGFISTKDHYLAALFIEPEHQGKGLGRKLLKHIQRNSSFLELKVFAKNLSAVKFYQKNGFKIVDEKIGKDTGEREFIMEWNKKKLFTTNR